MACPRPDRERRRWSQSSGSTHRCPSEAHSDLYLAQRSSTPRCSCPAGLSRPTLLVLTLVSQTQISQDTSSPAGVEGDDRLIINPFAMQEMTAVDNCSPLYNPFKLWSLFSLLTLIGEDLIIFRELCIYLGEINKVNT